MEPHKNLWSKSGRENQALSLVYLFVKITTLYFKAPLSTHIPLSNFIKECIFHVIRAQYIYIYIYTCLENTCNHVTKLSWTEGVLVFLMEQIYTTRAITGQTMNIISTGIPIKKGVCGASAL